MVKITQVYTRRGDDGKTSLAGNYRLSKSSARIIAIGEIDELNSSLGIIMPLLAESPIAFSNLLTRFANIQNQLFDIGAVLATMDRQMNGITHGDIKILEQEIDNFNTELPVLYSFILPGGSRASANLHLSRAICRRAERAVIKLSEEEVLPKLVIPYINRLSDWLFVVARWINKKMDISESVWNPSIK